MPTVAVLGASSDRRKFGNKSLRAHVLAGYQAFPVHPTETAVEGLPAFTSLADVPLTQIDRVTLYLPPPILLKLLPTFTTKTIGEVWFNPGTDTPEVLALAKSLGLNAIAKCSIVDLGYSPSQFPDA